MAKNSAASVNKPADATGTAAAALPKKKAAAKTAPTLKKLPPAAKAKAATMPVTEAGKAAKGDGKAKPAADTKEKARKPKLVRDSFTMPEAEYAALGEVKKACLKAGIDVKKSQLLRVGVALVRQLEVTKLKDILAALPELKAGRPKK